MERFLTLYKLLKMAREYAEENDINLYMIADGMEESVGFDQYVCFHQTQQFKYKLKN